MKRFNLEVTVGLFVVLGLCALAYLSVRLGQLQIGRGNTYDLIAVFPTVAKRAMARRSRKSSSPRPAALAAAVASQ